MRGDTTNELIALVGDPNVHIQETKALTANIVAGRQSRLRRAPTSGTLGGDVPAMAAARGRGVTQATPAPKSHKGYEHPEGS